MTKNCNNKQKIVSTLPTQFKNSVHCTDNFPLSTHCMENLKSGITVPTIEQDALLNLINKKIMPKNTLWINFEHIDKKKRKISIWETN